jgi:hypothetical protein
MRDAGSTQTNGTVTLTDGVWHHLAMVTSSTTQKLYVDGTLDITRTVSQQVASNAFNTVLNDGTVPTGGQLNNGEVDECAMFNTARYNANFTPPSSPYVGNEAGLVSVWHFDSSPAGVLGPVLQQ